MKTLLLTLCCSAAPLLAQAPAAGDAASDEAAPVSGEHVSPATAAPEASESLAALYDRRELCGFPLMVRRELEEADPELLRRVLLQLEADLDEVAHLVPAPALAALRRTTFWIERQGATIEGGMSGRGMCCHWSADWLESVGLPREKAGGVEILSPEDFLAWRRSQPYMTLHELAHAYHRMLGTDLPEVLEAFGHATEAGLYTEVGRNSVPASGTVEAYAATNHHEYFAELSEAFFAVNDFEPYTRPQLEAHDPRGFAMVQRLWNLSAPELAERIAAAGVVEPP